MDEDMKGKRFNKMAVSFQFKSKIDKKRIQHSCNLYVKASNIIF